jgi:hypothetical protein
MTTGALARVVLGLSIAGAAVAGCMALPKASAMLEDPPLDVRGTLPLRAALLPLRDARAPGEGATRSPGSAEEITSVLLTDLSEARVFSSVAFATEPPNADVLLRGEIRSLSWRASQRPLFIPGFGVLAALGVPVATSAADVGLALDVLSARTGEVLGSYAGSGAERRRYTIYTPAARLSGTDGPFRHAVEEIQQAMLADQARLVAAAKPPAR